jgi:hypothetical protein
MDYRKQTNKLSSLDDVAYETSMTISIVLSKIQTLHDKKGHNLTVLT